VVSGQRVPIELTALGRAWLAVAPERERAALVAKWRAKRRKTWSGLDRELTNAAADIAQRGYCSASWQPQVIALACPLEFANRPTHVVNISVTSAASLSSVTRTLEEPLLKLAAQLRREIGELDP
jgi:DNA-binding IclR family transcriptional regulator